MCSFGVLADETNENYGWIDYGYTPNLPELGTNYHGSNV